MIKRTLPSSASVATEGEGGRLVAPAASRNSDVLCDLLAQWGPTGGSALEIASGTGQHVSAFAQRLPQLHWQPTEVDPDRRTSIDAYSQDLPNISAAVALDATSDGWHQRFSGQDLIVLINLTHLISWQETRKLISEAALALDSGGRFVLYGPFMRSGKLTSDGDQRFHDALVQQDSEIGYKNDDDIATEMRAHGLDVIGMIDMPANNLAFIAEKTRT